MQNETPGIIDTRLGQLLRSMYFKKKRANNNQQAVASSVAKFVD